MVNKGAAPSSTNRIHLHMNFRNTMFSHINTPAHFYRLTRFRFATATYGTFAEEPEQHPVPRAPAPWKLKAETCAVPET
jgi:hypothetical protein